MKYYKEIELKNNKKCIIRSGSYNDGEDVLLVFKKAHGESDFLISYPDECSLTVESESNFIVKKEKSDREALLLAIVDDKIVGFIGLDSLGNIHKLRHRCSTGLAIISEYCSLGLGYQLMEACISLARDAGYKQMELDVVSDNYKAIGLYKKCGFEEYGRNPMGFNSRISGYQEVVYMRKEL